MTMGWMETIRFIGLDLQIATVLAGAGLDFTARTIKSAWDQNLSGIPSLGSPRVRARRPSASISTSSHCDGAAASNG